MTQIKILLLSVSAGAGHTRAAEALRSCSMQDNLDVTAIHLDVMAFVTSPLRKLYTDFYMWLIKRAPAMWSHVYRVTKDAKPDGRAHRLRRWVERLNCRPLLREIAACKPDIIICTHFLPVEILSQLIAKGNLDCPVWVQVTDFDLHPMWVHGRMAGYFAPNEEVAFRLRGQGIAAAAIQVTGIPIMPAFSAPPDRQLCAPALGLEPGVTTVLLMGGGSGLGSVDVIAERLLALPGNFQVIALAGKDGAALGALRLLAARFPGRLCARGHTGEIERLMACADLVVTKPGGLTTAESLAMGLPMIVIAPIPGQEEHNANFLLEQGAALRAFDLTTLEYRILYLLAHPAKLADMRARAKALGRPHAARQVLDTVLTHTQSHQCRHTSRS